ncbi:MAG: hypothetical protein CMP98_08755 [Gammaproteobacteria bacterium]|nr:hypothetical protein [Gammaproteobacteria bacterium]OUU09092.1 MAG: hypothetical protein CBB94_08980 [Gammaproteobacteria bacterium TMED34]
MIFGQRNPDNRNQSVVDLLVGQVRHDLGALDKNLGDVPFAATTQLTRADCSLVPALWMCSGSLPMLGADSPLTGPDRLIFYRERIAENENAARIIEETNRGLKARMDGTGRRMSEEGLTEAKVQQTENN